MKQKVHIVGHPLGDRCREVFAPYVTVAPSRERF